MSAYIFRHTNRSGLGKLLILSGAIALAAGCGGDSTSPSGGNQEVWNVVSQRSWTLGAQNEGYVCHSEQVASDEYITGFRLASPPAAQAEVYLLVSDSPSTSEDFACNFGTVLGNELLYTASYGTDSIKFSEGKGVHVAAGQYLLLVIHMNNTADTTVSVATKIEGRVGTAADVTTPIDMVFAGTVYIQAPNDGQTHTATGGCNPDASGHIVALLPLMRTLGTHQRVDLTINSTTQTLLDTSFDPMHVRYLQFTTDVSWPAQSTLQVTCSYVNNTAMTEHFGDDESSELCFNAMYRYPTVAPEQWSPFQCVPDIVSSRFVRPPDVLASKRRG